MFEAFFCLKCKVTTWLPLLYRWKIPCENDDDDNYVFRQKLHLAKLLSYTGCNTTKYLISSILNNQKFHWISNVEEKKLKNEIFTQNLLGYPVFLFHVASRIQAFRCNESLLFFWIIEVHFSALIRAICLSEIVLLFEALALNINFAFVERE